MKISLFRFYKTECVVFAALGLFILTGSIVFTICNYSGAGIDDFIMLFLCMPLGIFVALFPILLHYRQLTHVIMDEGKCVSYTLLRKKLCQVNLDKQVYYSFFDVRFPYSPLVRFIALSNMPFQCEQRISIAQKSFYGAYERTKIIIIPYDDSVAAFLKGKIAYEQEKSGS